jgi:hypothetical protein
MLYNLASYRWGRGAVGSAPQWHFVFFHSKQTTCDLTLLGSFHIRSQEDKHDYRMKR